MDITIGIPSIPERLNKECRNLVKDIVGQSEKNDVKSEILIFCDNGYRSIGVKRNQLLMRGLGEFWATMDDDDSIDGRYFSEFKNMKNMGADAMFFPESLYMNGKFDRIIPFSDTGIKHFHIYKFDMVRDILFQDRNYGDDTDWILSLSFRLKDKKKMESSIPMYIKNHSSVFSTWDRCYRGEIPKIGPIKNCIREKSHIVLMSIEYFLNNEKFVEEKISEMKDNIDYVFIIMSKIPAHYEQWAGGLAHTIRINLEVYGC